MALKSRFEAEMKSAMKGKDRERLSVLRMIRSEIKNLEIQEGHPLEDPAILTLISKAAKQRRESIAQFQKGGRDDLVQKETRELQIILEYLPQQLSADELRQAIEKAVAAVGATSVKDMGAVMKQVMADVGGRADGKEAQQLVRALLS
jgi:uncharacterized protein YqeY